MKNTFALWCQPFRDHHPGDSFNAEVDLAINSICLGHSGLQQVHGVLTYQPSAFLASGEGAGSSRMSSSGAGAGSSITGSSTTFLLDLLSVLLPFFFESLSLLLLDFFGGGAAVSSTMSRISSGSSPRAAANAASSAFF